MQTRGNTTVKKNHQMKKTLLTIATTLLLAAGLRAQESTCDILTTPWSENFNNAASLNCWTMLDYDGSTISEWMRTSLRAASGDGYSMLAYHTNQNCNDWMVTPVIQLPADSDGLVLTYEYYSVSSFNDYGEILIRVAPYGISGDIPEVDTAHFDAPLRLEHQGTNDFEHRGVSLANYAGLRVRIAFVQVGQHESNDFIDNVQVKSTTVPKVRLEAPARSHAWGNTTVDAFLYEGSLQGLSFAWHSSLLDFTFSVSNSQLSIVYPFAGIDTVTCIVSNIYGNDTAQIVIDVVDCSTVLRYPWKEDFEHGLDCWYQLGGWSAYNGIRGYDGGYDLRSNSSQSYGSDGSFWIISQPFALPDTLMMPELMWWMRTPSQYEGNQNQFSLRVAVVDSTEMPSEDDFTTVMSRTMYYGGWERFRFPLDAYAGQTVRFMFYNDPSHSGYGYYDCVLIDQMEVRSTRQPVVMIDAPVIAERIDSVPYTVVLDEGDTTGIVYTWHSTLLDSTWTLDHAGPHIVSYLVSGIDTITVIATNSYGIDTVTAIVTVNDCPALVLPVAVFDFEDSTQLSCWTGFVANYNNDALASSVNTWYRAGNATNHYMTPGVDLAWLVSPAIDLPADTSDLRLEWYQSGDRLGVFVSTDSNLFFEPADFPHTIQSISDAESFQNGGHSYSLAAFAGQRIHIAFCGVWASNLQLDDIHIASGYHVAPVATLTAPDSAMVGQTVSVSATLNVCSQRNIAYQWHSSLKGTTISASTLSPFTLTYETPGIDTVTLIVSNYYGTDTQQVVVVVEGCSAVAAPWSEDFEGVPAAGSNVQGNLPPCWDFTWNGSNSAYAPHVIANGGYQYISNIPSHAILFVAGNSTGYGYQAEVLLPPFGDSLQNLSIAFDYRFESTGQGSLTVGYYDGNDNFTAVQTMTPHAGNYQRDTVDFASVVDPGNARIALRWNCNTSWYAAIVDNIEVFTDPVHLSEPVVTISGPTHVALDDTVLFTANLLRGDTVGITYFWHSSLLDTTTSLSSPHFSLVYPLVGIDTISVITTNAYGTATAVSVVYVDTTIIDTLPNPMPLCDSPVTGIPWIETFAGGDDCWYKPAGSRWNDVIPYNDPALEHMRYLYLQMQNDQQGSWIISKGIEIPADTAVHPRLYWKVASNTSSYALHYGVLVTTSNDFTDTANYTEIYYDNSCHNQWSNYEQLSISLAQYAGQTIHIAFHNHPNMSPSDDRCVCIDDVEIRGNIPPVAELAVPDSAYTGSSTFITANVIGNTDNLSITWHSSLMDSTWTTTDNSTHIIYSVAGTDTLTAIVSNSYGVDTVVAVVRVLACDYHALPYFEDFESVQAAGFAVSGALPGCWDYTWNGSTAAYAPHVIANGGYSYISNIPDNALFMVAGSSSGYDTVAEAVLPAMAGNLQGLSLAFDYRYEMADWGTLVVGYYNDNDVFTPVQTMQPHSGSYRRDTVDFGFASSASGRIAMRWSYGNVYYAVVIDNIEVFYDSTSAALDTLPPASVINNPSVIYAGDSALFTATLLHGNFTGLTYTWHSSLLNTTWVDTLHAPRTSFRLAYPAGGIDTLTLTTANQYGSSVTSRVVTVNECRINTFPWSEDFESGTMPACWRTYCTNEVGFSWYNENYSYWAHGGSHCLVSNMGSGPRDWLMMPAIEVPAGGSLDLSFWVNFASNPNNGTLTVLASTTGRNSLDAFTDTLLHESNHTYYPNIGYQGTYVPRSVSLTPYAGQTVWVAFVSGPNALFLDDMSIDISGLPIVGLTGPTTTRSCDSTVFQATLLDGDTTGLTYTWHSSMVDAGLASASIIGDRMTIDYYAGGSDVITVIATNVVSSDTASRTCTVTDCEPVSEFPYSVALTSMDNLTCWDTRNTIPGDAGYWSSWRIGEHSCMTSESSWGNEDADAWLITQELAIPDDPTHSFTLQWHVLCDHSKYQVMASTAGRATLDLFTDTLFYEEHDTASWTVRTVSLDAYRGQQVYVAFRNLGWVNSPANYYDIGTLSIDTVGVIVALDTTPTPPDTIPVVDTVWRTVTVNAVMVDGSDEPMIADMVHGAGTYVDSSTVTLEGEVHGCSLSFVFWVTAEGDTLYDNPYTFVVTSDVSITAVFAWFGGIEEMESEKVKVEIYPNPATTDVTVRVSEPSTLIVIDMAGRVVIPSTAINSTFLLPHSSLAPGTYFVRVDTASGSSVKKLILQ